MNTSSTTAPGKIPPTSLNPTPTPEDSLVDVWVDRLRNWPDRDASVAAVVEDLWRWAS